jgi:hypothetical protein
VSYRGAPPGTPPGVGSPIGTGSTEIDRLRSYVAGYFPVYETRINPTSVSFLVAGDPRTLEDRFDRMRRDLWDKYYVPFIRYEKGEYVVEVVVRPHRQAWGFVPNLILLLATVATTILSGSLLWLTYVGGSHLVLADFLYGGLTFALPILGILGLHELAHFFTARAHHVEASLPFFIPVPPPLLFGTFGAFISLREPIPDRKALLDIGASGPLVGFAAAIPVTILGLYLSAHAPVVPLTNCGVTLLGVNYMSLVYGLSLFWLVLQQFIPISYVNLSPVALAGWVGLLVTAINLLPAGQLDGGHVFRALFGDRIRYVSYGVTLLLFILGIIFLYPGWFLFGLLILFLGLRHPPPLNDITPLDGKRWALGGVTAAVLVVAFVLVPIVAPSGSFQVNDPSAASTPPPPGYHMAGDLSALLANQDLIEHGFYLSASISSVVISQGGNTTSLNGTALSDFANTSTWVVHFPNGTSRTFADQPSFSLSGPDLVAVGSGGTGNLSFTYLNVAQGTVSIDLTVSEICSAAISGPGPKVVAFPSIS